MRQDVLLPLFEVMMLFISYSQSWPTATEIELVDTQDSYAPGYVLVMRQKWHTSSSWTGRTSFERPNLQPHSRPNEPLLIHGPSLVLANSGQDLSSPKAPHRMAYETSCKCIHVLKKASFICLICIWNFSLEITGNRIIRTCIVILYTHEMNALNH